jgi:hypothetical protein
MDQEVNMLNIVVKAQREALSIYKEALYRERSLLDRFLQEQATGRMLVLQVVTNAAHYVVSRIIDNSDATKLFDVILSLGPEQFELIGKVLTPEQMTTLVELLSRRMPEPVPAPSGKIDAEFVEDGPAPKVKRSRKKS